VVIYRIFYWQTTIFSYKLLKWYVFRKLWCTYIQFEIRTSSFWAIWLCVPIGSPLMDVINYEVCYTVTEHSLNDKTSLCIWKYMVQVYRYTYKFQKSKIKKIPLFREKMEDENGWWFIYYYNYYYHHHRYISITIVNRDRVIPCRLRS